MFYKTGIDITKDKSMFNFLKNHFEYYTANSWNCTRSIANNVKIYNLGLSGDCYTALSLLEAEDYETVRWMIIDWEREHSDYEVYFNGRSGGYLVLKEKGYNYHVLPIEVLNCDTYEEYKNYCREEYGSVKANRDDLRFYTQLVRDFDRLCDDIRNYCDELSNLNFAKVKMDEAVARFNDEYSDDLELLGFNCLVCDPEGQVDISEISTIKSLTEAFYRTASFEDCGYQVKSIADNSSIVKLEA